ncbi:hypothetical protein Bca101_005122 [Brassica carinata]
MSTLEDGVMSICCSRRGRKTARSLCHGGCPRGRKTITVASPANQKMSEENEMDRRRRNMIQVRRTKPPRFFRQDAIVKGGVSFN